MSDNNDLLDSNLGTSATYKEYDFPITFSFKIGTLANDFVATDANGKTVAYVRQKMFKFREAIMIYSNESKSNLLYKINADRIIDFNASYAFTDANDQVLGRVGRRGMRSLWKAHYEIFDNDNKSEYVIQEENPWAKVLDTLLCEVPLLGIFSGYLFNPKYAVAKHDGTKVARLSKEATFLGRRFKMDKLEDLPEGDGERMLLSLMMMILLERRRG